MPSITHLADSGEQEREECVASQAEAHSDPASLDDSTWQSESPLASNRATSEPQDRTASESEIALSASKSASPDQENSATFNNTDSPPPVPSITHLADSGEQEMDECVACQAEAHSDAAWLHGSEIALSAREFPGSDQENSPAFSNTDGFAQMPLFTHLANSGGQEAAASLHHEIREAENSLSTQAISEPQDRAAVAGETALSSSDSASPDQWNSPSLKGSITSQDDIRSDAVSIQGTTRGSESSRQTIGELQDRTPFEDQKSLSELKSDEFRDRTVFSAETALSAPKSADPDQGNSPDFNDTDGTARMPPVTHLPDEAAGQHGGTASGGSGIDIHSDAAALLRNLRLELQKSLASKQVPRGTQHPSSAADHELPTPGLAGHENKLSPLATAKQLEEHSDQTRSSEFVHSQVKPREVDQAGAQSDALGVQDKLKARRGQWTASTARSSRLRLLIGTGAVAALVALVVATIPIWRHSEPGAAVEAANTPERGSTSELREPRSVGTLATETPETPEPPASLVSQEPREARSPGAITAETSEPSELPASPPSRELRNTTSAGTTAAETPQTSQGVASSHIPEPREVKSAGSMTTEAPATPTDTVPEESVATGPAPNQAPGNDAAVEPPNSERTAGAPFANPRQIATEPASAYTPRQLDPKEIALLVRRGEDFLAVGDIPAARLVLQRAAEARDARAALVLGSTYDPIMLERLKVRGPTPDIALAQTWYERAKEFGSAEATRRLEILASRGQEQHAIEKR